ncbi:MAG: ABC transporter permease [Chloroflexota bacterium]|jgi:osmoprotectant transport system permease protein
MQPGQPLINFQWIVDHLGAIWTATVQHVELTVIPVVLGFVIALALSIWAARRPIVYGPFVTLGGILYTIPSLALFAVLIPITGLSLVSAVIPLVTYTILIYLRSIVAGIRGVAPDVIEAAEGMGYTSRQRLTRVELPLAVPMMITGVRLATVTTIGLVTVASIVGGSEFGGYGQLITEGLQTLFPTKYLLGAALSVLLAMTADTLLVRFERRVTPWARARSAV